MATSFLTQQSTSGLEGMPQLLKAKFLKPCDIDCGLDPLSPAQSLRAKSFEHCDIDCGQDLSSLAL